MEERTQANSGWVEWLAQPPDRGVLVLDAAGDVTRLDARSGQLLGLPREELGASWPAVRKLLEEQSGLGTGFWERPRAAVEVEFPASGGTPHRLLFQSYRLDGPEGGHLLLVSSHDEAASTALDVRLASQMHTLSHLYRAMAHDLRAPLNAMVVNLELLGDSVASDSGGGETGERRRRYVRALKQEMQRLIRRTQAFLGYVAPPVYGDRDVDLASELRDLEEFVGPQARKQEVDLELDLPAGAALVRGSADDLRQAVLGLVVNSLEAQPDGGRVTVGLETDDGRVRVWVEDDGPGLPRELAASEVFAPHVATSLRGHGIGLAVAQAIAVRHGGRLTVDTEPGEGSRFVMDLPAARREER